MTNVVSVSAGNQGACAVLSKQVSVSIDVDGKATTESGQVLCWGENQYANVGDSAIENGGGDLPGDLETDALSNQLNGTTPETRAPTGAQCYDGESDKGVPEDSYCVLSPVFVSLNPKAGTVTQVTTGIYQSCAIQGAKEYCWGGGFDGGLGIATPPDSCFSTPGDSGSGGPIECSYDPQNPVVAKASLSTLTSVDSTGAGEATVCAIATQSKNGSVVPHSVAPIVYDVVCWGDNAGGQIGDGGFGTLGACAGSDPCSREADNVDFADAAAGPIVYEVNGSTTLSKSDVYYMGANDQLYNWHFDGYYWSNGELGGNGGGIPAATGSEIAAVLNPSSSPSVVANIFYVDSSNQVADWVNTGVNGEFSHFTDNGELQRNGPAGEPAKSGSSIAAEWNGNTLFVFYVGTDTQDWAWEYSGTWSNVELDVGGISATDTGIAAVLSPTAPGKANIFYVGGSGQVADYVYDGSGHFIDNGLLNGGIGEPAKSGTSLAAKWNNGILFVYYVGLNNQVYAFEFKSGTWSNVKLGGGGVAAIGAGVAAALRPSSGNKANVFYVGTGNEMFNWYFNGSSFGGNTPALGSGVGFPALMDTGIAPSWITSTTANVFYVGSDRQVHVWSFGPWVNTGP